MFNLFYLHMSLFKIIKNDVRKKTVRQLIANFRNEYLSDGIDEKKLKDNPIEQFEMWFQEAVDNKLLEPNAMNLSTVSSQGKPSSRILLLKGFDERGFVFYSNYESRKALELQNNPCAAITFLWLELYKQVRIEGVVIKIPPTESDVYFQSRPRGSQLGAWVSAQSKVIRSREELEIKQNELTRKFEGKEISRPDNWGGFCLQPNMFEFWLGRAGRLHDRIVYSKNEQTGTWEKQRLAP